MEAKCPAHNRHRQGRLENFRLGGPYSRSLEEGVGWKPGDSSQSCLAWHTRIYFEGRRPSGEKLIEIIGEGDGGKDPHTSVEDLGVPATPIRVNPEGALCPRRGAVLTVCAAPASSNSSSRSDRGCRQGRMVPSALPAGAPTAAHSCSPPALELSAPRRVPDAGPPPRPEEP